MELHKSTPWPAVAAGLIAGAGVLYSTAVAMPIPSEMVGPLPSRASGPSPDAATGRPTSAAGLCAPGGESPGGRDAKKEVRLDDAKPVKRLLVEVVAMDAAKRKIVYFPVGAMGSRLLQVQAAGDAVFTVDGKQATLRDIPRGGIAALTTTGFWPESNLVTKVEVTGPTLIGLIKSIDATILTVSWSRSLTHPYMNLQYSQEVGRIYSITEAQFEEIFVRPPRVVSLAEGGKVLVDGKEGKLSELKIGSLVQVMLTSDRSKILAVESVAESEADALGPRKAGRGDELRPQESGRKQLPR